MEPDLPRDFKARQRSRSRNRTLAALSLVVILVAWLIGGLRRQPAVAGFVKQVIPEAAFVDESGGLWLARGSSGGPIIAYAAVGRAPGDGGPIGGLRAKGPKGKGLGVGARRRTPGDPRHCGKCAPGSAPSGEAVRSIRFPRADIGPALRRGLR